MTLMKYFKKNNNKWATMPFRLTLYIPIVALCILASNSFAQRNYNQKNFKSSSWNKYQKEQKVYYDNNSNGLFNTGNLQQAGNVGGVRSFMKDNEMVFEIRSMYNAKASNYLVEFNLTQVGETAQLTEELMDERIDSFITGLLSLGVDQKNVYVDMIYLVPMYKFNVEEKLFSKTTYNEVPSGFEMQKNVHVVFQNINWVDEMVSLAAKSEIYDLVKLDFFADQTEEIYDTLMNACIKQLNKRLDYMEKIDINLRQEKHVMRDFQRAIYPETQYNNYDAFVSQSLEAAKKKTVSKLRKPKTVAYDQVAYNEFDIIINPVILEPAIQFVYTLQVKYTIEPKKDPVQKPETKFMLVTPSGVVKPLILK